MNLGQAIHAHFAAIGGVELELPARGLDARTAIVHERSRHLFDGNVVYEDAA